MGGVGGGILITSRHLLLTTHMRPYTGYRFLFVAANGAQAWRDVIAEKMIAYDLTVASFAVPLPRSIQPVVFPDRPMIPLEPVRFVNQFERVSCMAHSTSEGGRFWLRAPGTFDEAVQYETPINLDSGSPVIRLERDVPVLVGVLSYLVLGMPDRVCGGDDVWHWRKQIQEAVGGEPLGELRPPVRQPTRVGGL